MKDKYNVGIHEGHSQDDSCHMPVKTREEILGKRQFLTKTNSVEIESLIPLNA
jgi:hypothetical protein